LRSSARAAIPDASVAEGGKLAAGCHRLDWTHRRVSFVTGTTISSSALGAIVVGTLAFVVHTTIVSAQRPEKA
jgi:hypothetical protein